MSAPPDPVAIEDWKGRGITPIPYDSLADHVALAKTLSRWSDLSAINGDSKEVDALVRRLVKNPRATAEEEDRDLFDHLFRRSAVPERLRLASLASKSGAEIAWLDAIADIGHEF